jgi:proteasome accessory factor C
MAMDKLHRITELKRILQNRRTPITLRQLTEQMQCSESTARRMLHSFRDDFGAPLGFDRRRGGWYLANAAPEGTNELPGLWFTTAELHALLAARELLSQLGPSPLAAETAAIRAGIERLLAQRGIAPADITQRVRLQAPGMRPCPGDTFALITRALFERRRLRVRYLPRGRPTAADEPPRDISPQRLTWLNGRWFIDNWCHHAKDLRRFAIERIQTAELLPDPAEDLPQADLDARLDSAYGSFTGPPTATAILRFTPERARWVAEEQWHHHQQASWLPDGRCQLTVPYARPDELLMEILKYGPDCEVIAPPELRAAALERLRGALGVYAETDSR